MKTDKELDSKKFDKGLSNDKSPEKEYGQKSFRTIPTEQQKAQSSYKKNRMYQAQQANDTNLSDIKEPSSSVPDIRVPDSSRYNIEPQSEENKDLEHFQEEHSGFEQNLPKSFENNHTPQKTSSFKKNLYYKHHSSHPQTDKAYDVPTDNQTEATDTSINDDTKKAEFAEDTSEPSASSSDDREFNDKKSDEEFSTKSGTEFSDRKQSKEIKADSKSTEYKENVKKKTVYKNFSPKEGSDTKTDDGATFDDTSSPKEKSPEEKQQYRYEKAQKKSDKVSGKYQKAKENLPHKTKLKKKKSDLFHKVGLLFNRQTVADSCQNQSLHFLLHSANSTNIIK